MRSRFCNILIAIAVNISSFNRSKSCRAISQGFMLLRQPPRGAHTSRFFFNTYVISKLQQKHVYKSSVNRLVSKRAFNTVMERQKQKETKQIKVKTTVRVEPSMSVRGRRVIPASVAAPTAGLKSVKLERNVDGTQSVCCWSSEASVSVPLGEVKALIVIYRLEEFLA